MSQIDVNSVLSQMRALGAQASDAMPSASLPASSTKAAGMDFSTLFKQSLGAVTGLQNQAQAQTTAFERGDPSSDIVKTSIAGQKADLAFRGLVEVRNKLVDAYTTIMNMPV
jgi:flagellar hook-basal body complex protein FliE